MFVDFDKIFNDDPKSQFNVPPGYIEYLNEGLPKGLKYTIDKDGNYVISPEGNEIKISGIKMILTEEQKKVLGSKYKFQDILDYAYNSQQKIEIQPIEPGYIRINEQKISIDKLVENPLKPIKVIEGKAYMFPPKFDQKIEIKLGDGKYERFISVIRVPDNSVKVLSFKSKETEPLKVNYSFDKSTNDLKMNISFDLNYAKTIRDIVESIYIYNAFIDGKGYINGKLLELRMNNNQYKKYDEKSALFWEKVLKVEAELGTKFIPPKGNLEYNKILEIEELYQSLVVKRPFKSRTLIDTIDYKIGLDNRDEMENYINKTLRFQFDATYTGEILGCKVNLQALIMAFYSKILKIEKNKQNATIILGDESEEKKRYSSVMYFKDNKQIEKFKEQLDDETMEAFRNAKSANQYLNDDENK